MHGDDIVHGVISRVGIFYGGDHNTLHQNKGFPIDEALSIYNGFMAKFTGVKKYQDYCRARVFKDGYVLMNPVTLHRAHIIDMEWLLAFKKRMSEDGFWEEYRFDKKYNPNSQLVKDFRRYNKRKSECERESINYRIQNRGSGCFKLAMIKYFNWIKERNYQNIVKIAAIVHDECNVECPESLEKEAGDKLVECMIAGGKPYCPNVYLGADLSVGPHWIH